MKKLVLILAGLLLLSGCGSGKSSKVTPVISVSLTPSAQTSIDQGQTLNYAASVTNDAASAGVAWSMSGTGCTGTACGTFTGGTTSAATYNAPASVSAKMTVTIVATSVSDSTKSTSSAVVVNPAPSISATSPSGGTVGSAYSATLQASGGVGTLTWSLAAGSSLPGGLTLSSTGAISGTPTTAGTTSFTVKVTDQSAAQQGPVSVTQTLSITIAAPAISVSINPSVQTSIDQGQSLNFTASVANDSASKGVTWAASGATCTGNACGTLTNATTAAATYNAPASGSSNMTVAVQAFSVADPTKSASAPVVVAPLPTIATTTLAGGTVGTAYSATLQASGGTGTLTWSLASGSSLPAGLSLSAAGMITGTPTAAGATNVTVKVTDASQAQQGPAAATQQLSLTIAPQKLTITTTTLPNATAGTAYSAPLKASGGTAPYSWTVATGSTLPSWLSLTGSGTSWSLTGTPTASGTASFSLTVSDSSTPQQTQSQGLSVTIIAAAACSDSGSESLLHGQYAFSVQGYSDTGFLGAIGSFTADGTGKITAGVLDSNGTIVQSATSLDTTQSFYKVGANHLGCLTIVTSAGTFTTKISLGEISSNIATEGRLVEWDSAVNVNYLTATGQLRLQAVPTNLSSGNYTYLLTGIYESSNLYRAGIVGTVTTKPGTSGGSITGGEYDINVEGVINAGNGITTPFSGMNGAYTALDQITGRFTDSATLDGITVHHVNYALSSSEYAQLSTDALTTDVGIYIGGAKLQGTSPSLTTGSNLVYYVTGTESAEIGLINVTSSSAYSGTYYEDIGGVAQTPQTPSCGYSIDSFGRMQSSGAACTMYLTTYSKMYPPVMYLTANNKGYMLGTGVGVYAGQFEPQVAPSGGFSNATLSGTFFDGDTEVVNQSVSGEMLGVEALTLNGTGGVDIVGDYIGSYVGNAVTREVDQSQTSTMGTVNSNGTFNTDSSYGQINAIVISTTKVVNINQATETDPIIQVIKPISPEI